MGDLWALKGSGQILENVHTQDQCAGQWCTIHNPLPGPWDDWPMYFTWRGMMRQCPHGNLHDAVEEIYNGRSWGIHGCCYQCKCSIAWIEWEKTNGPHE